MKKNSLQFISGFLVFTSLCSMVFVLQPAVFPLFNLSSQKTANIGSTLGGVVGPIVGIFSAYLLYEALSAQLNATKQQIVKGKIDIIFLLLSQFEQEYKSFQFSTRARVSGMEVKTDHTGYAALVHFCKTFVAEDTSFALEKFKQDMNSYNILYLVRSFEMIGSQVSQIEQDGGNKALLLKKLDIFYKTKFKVPIELLALKFEGIEDPLTIEICQFARSNVYL